MTKPSARFRTKRKMKLFQTLQKNMATMGFNPNQQGNDSYRKLSIAQFFAIGIFLVDIGTVCVYILHEAKGIVEYMDAIFELIVSVTILVAFVSLTFKNNDIFDVLERTEKELTDRE